jgi:hypothetical protein
MSTDTFLAREEIHGLTNKVKQSAQIRALNSMGIEHRVRPDGSVAILRDHISKVFGGVSDSVRKSTKANEPNWDAI